MRTAKPITLFLLLTISSLVSCNKQKWETVSTSKINFSVSDTEVIIAGKSFIMDTIQLQLTDLNLTGERLQSDPISLVHSTSNSVDFLNQTGNEGFDIIGTNIVCSGGACAWQFGIASGSCASLTWEGCVSDGNACVNGPDPSAALTGSTADGFALSWSGVTDFGFTGTMTPTGGGTYTGTETFYLVMDGNANADCEFTLSGVNLQPLPIELISFYAKKYNNANRIFWEVASESNNDYFTIERSNGSGVWEEVGMIQGAGTTTEQRLYGFTDERFPKAMNYYRLKQTDFDGKFEYSKLISVNNSEVEKSIVSIVNAMGQEVSENDTGLKIFVYSDGTTEKKY
jgi:hypothetical protein